MLPMHGTKIEQLHLLKITYINRLRVFPMAEPDSQENSLPARLTGDSLYLRGLEVALNRGLDAFEVLQGNNSTLAN